LPLEVRDDRARNLLELTEHYKVPRFWRDEERSLYTDATDEFLKLPHVLRRTLPLALGYPIWVTQTFDVVLPFESSFETRRDTAGDGIIEFERSIRSSGFNVTASFEYRSFAARVPVEKVSEHVKALHRARQWNTLNLTDESNPQTATRSARSDHGPMYAFWLVGGIVLAALVWPVTRGVRSFRRRRAFKRLRQGAKGETPALPENVATLSAADAMLSKLRCSCGEQFGSAQVQWSTLRYQGSVLHAGRITCSACDDSECRYFQIKEAVS
jgi:hypothetical protein